MLSLHREQPSIGRVKPAADRGDAPWRYVGGIVGHGSGAPVSVHSRHPRGDKINEFALAGKPSVRYVPVGVRAAEAIVHCGGPNPKSRLTMATATATTMALSCPTAPASFANSKAMTIQRVCASRLTLS